MKKLLDWLNEEKAKSEETIKEIENRKEFTVASYHTGRAIAFSDCIEKIKEICERGATPSPFKQI